MKMTPLLKMTCAFSVIPIKSQYHFSQNKTKPTIHAEAQEIPSGQSSPEESDAANLPGLDCARARTTKASLGQAQSRLRNE